MPILPTWTSASRGSSRTFAREDAAALVAAAHGGRGPVIPQPARRRRLEHPALHPRVGERRAPPSRRPQRWPLTALVSYHDRTSGDARARRQLAGLHAFLRCAGVPGLTAEPSPGVLEQAVLASATHTRDTASYQSQLSPSVRCLWERLRNGSALRHRPPCIVGGASVERLGTVR